MRRGKHPASLFDRLEALGLVATIDEARELNARIRDERLRAGEVDDSCTVIGKEGLSFGRGDVIQTR